MGRPSGVEPSQDEREAGGAVRRDADRYAPVLTGQVTRRVVALRIARGRLRDDLKHATGYVRGNDQPAGQLGGGTGPVEQQLRRRRGDLEPGGRAERLVELLPGRRREDHVEGHLARREQGRRAL